MSFQISRLAWHHFILKIPVSWEVIGYTTNDEKGQLVLSDRHGETMRIFWGRMKQRPALKRRVIEFVTEETDSDLEEDAVRKQLREMRGWAAFLPADVKIPSVACRYLEEERILLSLVFPLHCDTADSGLPKQILKSFRPNRGEERVWAAFGLDFTMPEKMKLNKVSAMPAAQVMRFENSRGESVTVHRYGMLPCILGEGDMDAFFTRVKDGKPHLYREGEFTKDGKYSGIKLSYKTRGKGGIEAFMARTWQGRVWVWRCDELKRLYCVDNNAREANLIDDLAERVNCR